MIVIDGSEGEGGGQILRTALSLAMVTGQSFRIDKIRAGREKPGLLRQHLAAVLAAVKVSHADAIGAELGSTSITFKPKQIQAGEYHFAVGTAGSGTLVLQTVLPALMTARAASRLVIEGGTHNTYAPPVDFIQKCFLPLLERMGPKVKIALEKYGFYPAGGGRFTVEIEPVAALQTFVLEERGELAKPFVHALIANLKAQIGLRELETVGQLLGLEQEQLRMVQTRESVGPGNVVMIEVAGEQVTELFTEFGKVGVSAERVATDAVKQAKAYIESTTAVGEHLADQLLLPMALAGGGSFTTTTVSRHAETNMKTIQKFLPVHFTVEKANGATRIAVSR